MRRFFCIFLLMCLPLHGFAMQWGMLLTGENTTIMHEVEHDEHIQHHHEDDGTIHYDDSGESDDHMLDHPATPHPLHLAIPAFPGAPVQLVSRVLIDADTCIPDPLLDCPHKPPAFALG